MLEEREAAGVKAQTVFSPVYVDAVVARDTLDATAAVGGLDAGFSGDGKWTQSLGSADVVRAVQQADGKIVVVGDAGVNSSDAGLARFNADGTLDATFDGPGGTPGNGVFTVDFGGFDQLQGVAVQPDGKIVVVGYSANDFLVARFNTNGSYDTAFDGPSGAGNGWFKLDFSGTTDSGVDVAVQADGKVLLAGVRGTDMVVARLTAVGAWDAGYGTSGYRLIDVGGGTDRALQLAVDRDGRAVVTGDTTSGGTGGDVATARLTTAGALDATFGTAGVVTTSFTGGADSGREVEVDDWNRVVVAATGGGDFNVVRYLPNGSLDSTFDGPTGTGDGKVSVDVSGTDTAQALALDGFGRVLVSGSVASTTDFGVVRLRADGTLDPTFDGDGKQTVGFAAGATVEECQTMLVQTADGRVVLAGRSNGDFAVARLGGGGARHYLAQDANFSVTATADATGAAVDRYQYTAYGVWAALNPDFSVDAAGSGEVYQAFYYQGLRFDGNSQNHHARRRDYRASLGQWTQVDPAGYTDGLNSWLSNLSSPNNHVDPFGLEGVPLNGPRDEVGERRRYPHGRPNWGEEWSNQEFSHTSVTYLVCGKGRVNDSVTLADKLYRDFSSFTSFANPGGNNSRAALLDGGDYAEFNLVNVFWRLGSVLKNSDKFKVRLFKDPARRMNTAVTVGSHPLVGIRIWEVFIGPQDKNCCIPVTATTRAVESARGRWNWFGGTPVAFYARTDGIELTWDFYFTNLQTVYSGSQGVTSTAWSPTALVTMAPGSSNPYRPSLPKDWQ